MMPPSDFQTQKDIYNEIRRVRGLHLHVRATNIVMIVHPGPLCKTDKCFIMAIKNLKPNPN